MTQCTKKDITGGKVRFLVHRQLNRTCLSVLKYPIPYEGVIQTYLTRYDGYTITCCVKKTIPVLPRVVLRPVEKECQWYM